MKQSVLLLGAFLTLLYLDIIKQKLPGFTSYFPACLVQSTAECHDTQYILFIDHDLTTIQNI